MHLKRWITGIVGVPLLILWVTLGGMTGFKLLIAAVGIAALWEYLVIILPPRSPILSDPLPLTALGFGTILVWVSDQSPPGVRLGLISAAFIVLALFTLPRFKRDRAVGESAFRIITGLIYISLSLSYLVSLRQGDAGIYWVFLLLVVIFAGDTGAFYVGTFWGRRKLCPSVSPGKTVEGALGGIAANLIFGACFKEYYLPALPWGASLLMFVCLGAVGQAGDLFESVLKRAANVKDSGNLLPGHGGVLDRIDAVLFAAPVAAFFKSFVF